MGKNTEFHTYKPKQERSFIVVLKNSHPSTDLNGIKQSLIDTGHVVTNIWNVKQRVTNKPLPMHFVDVKPRENNLPPTWPDQATLEVSCCTTFMICTGGCGYSF